MKSKLQQWAENGWLQPQPTSKEEIARLHDTVERDFSDLAAPVSDDTRFIIAHRALIALCTVLVRACGYRVERDNHHDRSIAVLPVVLGEKYSLRGKYFQVCRKKRHELTYEMVGIVTGENVRELVEAVRTLRADTMAWLEARHPGLV